MASEDIGSLYPTKMPGYANPADIQAALRLYHYGSETYDPTNTDEDDIVPNSVVGHIKALDSRIDDLEATGVGSDYRASEPTSPVDGFIWVDASSSVGTLSSAIVAYQTSAPSNPVTGTLWVDSTNTNALALKVYDGTTWKVIS
jgi:hypothetical protein